MSGQAPPAIPPRKPAKQADRAELLKDAGYFATELVVRLERLQKIEPSGRLCAMWQQAAALVRRVRGLLRHQLDEHRQRVKREMRGRP